MNEAERLAKEAAEKAEQAARGGAGDVREGAEKVGNEAQEVYETGKEKGTEAVERVRGTEPPPRETTGARPAEPVRPSAYEEPVRQSSYQEPRGAYEEPRSGAPWGWIVGIVGALVVAGLAGWGIWAAVDDDDDDDSSDVAGVQSESVDIESGGFSENDLEVNVGDSVDFTHDADDDCELLANGTSLTTVSMNSSYTWTAEETGVFLFECDGVDGILSVTVDE